MSHIDSDLNVVVDNILDGVEPTEGEDKPNNKGDENKCNFWELITDVVRDLDLALQDLSPDLDLSANLANNVSIDNACLHPLSFGQPESLISPSPMLLDPVTLRTAGNDESKSGKGSTQSEIVNKPNSGPIRSRDELDSPPSPAPALPAVASVSSKLAKPSYSSQLLTVMGHSNNSNHTNNNISNNNELPVRLSRTDSPISSRSSPEPESSSVMDGSACEEVNSGASNESLPASIGLLERLMRSHPIWFLPEIGRAGVVHLLQGKDAGCFIVRQSSKPNTMALSVRLPEGRGPHVEHYLIEDAGNGKLHLEGSENHFSAVPMLVCHYAQCCDELPVQLTLPSVLMQSTRQQLTSLALLGQDFWQSTLSKMSNNSDSNELSYSNSPISLCRLLTAGNHLNDSDNSAVKSSPPPPVPPKQDITDLDPMIDPKKSSTVQTTLTTQQNIPKVPPRTSQPPPVPPRTSKVLLRKQSLSNNSNAQCNGLDKTIASAEEVDKSSAKSKTTVTITCNSSSNENAPNAEVALIDLNKTNDVKLLPLSSPDTISSQSNEIITNGDDSIERKGRVKCYRSALDDKVSDYEDIWEATTSRSKKKTVQSKLDSVEEKQVVVASNDKLDKETQTEESVLNSLGRVSPFYTEPIDAIRSVDT